MYNGVLPKMKCISFVIFYDYTAYEFLRFRELIGSDVTSNKSKHPVRASLAMQQQT